MPLLLDVSPEQYSFPVWSGLTGYPFDGVTVRLPASVLFATDAHSKTPRLPELPAGLARCFPTDAEAKDYDQILPMRLKGVNVNAYLDTGGAFNVVSNEWTERNGLTIRKHKRPKKIPAPGGYVLSQGTIKVPCQFEGEQYWLSNQQVEFPRTRSRDPWFDSSLFYAEHSSTGNSATDDSVTDCYAWLKPEDKRRSKMLTFEVIKNCPRDVILGVKFIRGSQIFTKHKEKLKKARRTTSTGSFHVVGSHRRDHLVRGMLGNKSVRALVDTCADANIISRQMAQWSNLPIDSDPAAQVKLRRVDGSIVQSTGIVRDVEWAFAADGTPHRLDFYVLDDVDFHVILGKDFLYEIDAFTRYPLLLGSSGGLIDGLYVIQLVNEILSTKVRKLIPSKRTTDSKNIQHDLEDEYEQNYQTAMEGWIKTLSGDERETEWQNELKRREQRVKQQLVPPVTTSPPQINSGQAIRVR